MPFESLDKEHARQERRLNPNAMEPVKVSTISDLKAVIATLSPALNRAQHTIPLTTQLAGFDPEGRPRTYQVTADTKSKSQRDILIEGLDIIRNRMNAGDKFEGEAVEINGQIMKPAMLGTGIRNHWVDPLIRQWLGGARDGLLIYWELADGYRYEYNIYEHKLTRFRNNESEQS